MATCKVKDGTEYLRVLSPFPPADGASGCRGCFALESEVPVLVPQIDFTKAANYVKSLRNTHQSKHAAAAHVLNLCGVAAREAGLL